MPRRGGELRVGDRVRYRALDGSEELGIVADRSIFGTAIRLDNGGVVLGAYGVEPVGSTRNLT